MLWTGRYRRSELLIGIERDDHGMGSINQRTQSAKQETQYGRDHRQTGSERYILGQEWKQRVLSTVFERRLMTESTKLKVKTINRMDVAKEVVCQFWNASGSKGTRIRKTCEACCRKWRWRAQPSDSLCRLHDSGSRYEAPGQ